MAAPPAVRPHARAAARCHGHTWYHAEQVLFEVTKHGPAALVGGGYERDMPDFTDVLSDAEIRAVVDYIKSIWPERERAIQTERSRAYRDEHLHARAVSRQGKAE